MVFPQKYKIKISRIMLADLLRAVLFCYAFPAGYFQKTLADKGEFAEAGT